MLPRHFIAGFIAASAPMALGRGGDGPYVVVAGTYLSSSSEQKTLVNNRTVTVAQESSELDLALTVGFAVGNGLLIGGQYLSISEDFKSTANTTTKSKVETSAAGIALGFGSGGLLVHLVAYVLSPPERTVDNPATVYSGGDGMAFDVGYGFDLKGWTLGPQLHWHSMTFKTRTLNGQKDDTFESLELTDMKPFLAASMQL